MADKQPTLDKDALRYRIARTQLLAQSIGLVAVLIGICAAVLERDWLYNKLAAWTGAPQAVSSSSDTPSDSGLRRVSGRGTAGPFVHGAQAMLLAQRAAEVNAYSRIASELEARGAKLDRAKHDIVALVRAALAKVNEVERSWDEQQRLAVVTVEYALPPAANGKSRGKHRRNKGDRKKTQASSSSRPLR